MEKVMFKRGSPRIVCAANKLSDGRVVVGARHWDEHMHRQLEDYMSRMGKTSDIQLLKHEEQGFIDQFGKFYSRREAWELAEKNGQIIWRGSGCDGPDLYSENLY
jgi:hypothetical protein